MTAEQKEVLTTLETVLQAATDNGLLDELACYAHPDIINQFCDAVDSMIKTKQSCADFA